MSERYSKLFALSENLYSSGSPVVIAAGALQKDNQTGKVFAQLKIRNIQDKSIKATTVKIAPFDTAGKPLGGTVDYQYLDLSAGRDADFGQKTPVMLKDAVTRSFAVSVSEVVFSDNSVWTASNEAWEPLSPPVALETALSDNELVKQYRIKYGADCKCTFNKEKDLWRCACGAINHDGEKNCHSCQKDAAALAALDVEELASERDQRLEAEQKKAAEEKAAAEKAAEERAKKTKKIAMIAAPIVVVVIIAAVLVSNHVKLQNAYNNALALVEAGQYDKAVTAFMELGDYKDSAEQISETRYVKALALRENGEYAAARYLFTELGDYKDSAGQITETRYAQALDLRGKGKYSDAINAFTELGDYKDSAEQLETTFRMSMTNSIADTYKQLQASTDDSEYIQELKAICYPYIRYCGSFEGKDATDERQYTLTSDFFLHNNDICWKVEMPLKPTLNYGSFSHRPFVDMPDNDLIVNSSMEVTDTTTLEERDDIGVTTFKDGKIYMKISFIEESYIEENGSPHIYFDITFKKVS